MKNLEELTLKKEDEEELEEVKNVEEVYRSILPQRKAFIEFNDVYQKLLENHKDLKDELAEIKIYEYFVREYLSIESPQGCSCTSWFRDR